MWVLTTEVRDGFLNNIDNEGYVRISPITNTKYIIETNLTSNNLKTKIIKTAQLLIVKERHWLLYYGLYAMRNTLSRSLLQNKLINRIRVCFYIFLLHSFLQIIN